VQPTFLFGHIFGVLNLIVVKFSGYKKETNKKAIAAPGKERIHNHWVPERKIHKPQFEDLIRTRFFVCQSKFGKEGTP